MKHEALFPQKDKSQKTKCRLLQFLFSALRVKKRTSIVSRLIMPSVGSQLYENTSMIFYHFYKGKQLCDFLFAFLDNVAPSK